MRIFGQTLPVGLRRALILVSAIWVIGYYLTNKDAIDFSWTVGASTPRTMCSDVYTAGDKRLGECEAAGPESFEELYIKRMRGEIVEVPFDHYQKARHEFSVWYWLLGVPIALFVLAHAVLWVIAGFKANDSNFLK